MGLHTVPYNARDAFNSWFKRWIMSRSLSNSFSYQQGWYSSVKNKPLKMRMRKFKRKADSRLFLCFFRLRARFLQHLIRTRRNRRKLARKRYWFSPCAVNWALEFFFRHGLLSIFSPPDRSNLPMWHATVLCSTKTNVELFYKDI